MVKQVLFSRSNWKECYSSTSNVNFRWYPFSKGIKFEDYSTNFNMIVNHYEFHGEITTKNDIVKNIGRLNLFILFNYFFHK